MEKVIRMYAHMKYFVYTREKDAYLGIIRTKLVFYFRLFSTILSIEAKKKKVTKETDLTY